MLISASSLGIILKVGDQKFRIKITFNIFFHWQKVFFHKGRIYYLMSNFRGEGGQISDESGLKH